MRENYTYHPMHMHLHTCFQPGMSMAAHMYNTHKLGMKYIWFTDGICPLHSMLSRTL